MEIELKNANCTQLSLSAPVQLAKEAEKKGEFEIDAYTGAVVDRWWGKLAIELTGIQAGQQMPVFLGHDQSKIVGWTNKSWLDNAFKVSGKFSQATDAAKEAAALADEGFPWQASIGVIPKKIMELEREASHVVNGMLITGPAEIWLESEVFETSFVPLGADGNTSIATFSKFEEKAPPGANHNHKEEKSMEFTRENLEKEAPELLKSIQAEAETKGHAQGLTQGKADGMKEGLAAGATAERERIQAVMEQSMPGHEGLVQKLAFDGKTTGPEAAVQILAAEKTIRKTAAAHLAADAIDPVPPATPPATDPPKDPEVTAENFNTHKDLKEEFGSFDVYSAYLSAMDRGAVKITGGK